MTSSFPIYAHLCKWQKQEGWIYWWYNFFFQVILLASLSKLVQLIFQEDKSQAQHCFLKCKTEVLNICCSKQMQQIRWRLLPWEVALVEGYWWKPTELLLGNLSILTHHLYFWPSFCSETHLLIPPIIFSATTFLFHRLLQNKVFLSEEREAQLFHWVLHW